MGTPIQPQEWNAAADVQLVRHVSVAADPQGTRGLDARVTVAENAVATVRLEGTRVYVDVVAGATRLRRAAGRRVVAPAPAVAAPSAPRRAERVAPERSSARAGVGPSAARGACRLRRRCRAPGAWRGCRPRRATWRATARRSVRSSRASRRFSRSCARPSRRRRPKCWRRLPARSPSSRTRCAPPTCPRSAQGAHGLMTSAVQLARGAVVAHLHRRPHDPGARGDGAVPSGESPASLSFVCGFRFGFRLQVLWYVAAGLQTRLRPKPVVISPDVIAETAGSISDRVPRQCAGAAVVADAAPARCGSKARGSSSATGRPPSRAPRSWSRATPSPGSAARVSGSRRPARRASTSPARPSFRRSSTATTTSGWSTRRTAATPRRTTPATT